ncbi:MAG: lysine 5,6-aminomutase subunit alpha, partial [bacterium]|nr:lysine 5,6-aminomutase subunit alpha [bacterium]
IRKAAKHLSEEITFVAGGRIEQRANQVLDEALELLLHIESVGLLEAIEQGVFADVKRGRFGGKGLDGVVKKAVGYTNPFADLMALNNEQRAISF